MFQFSFVCLHRYIEPPNRQSDEDGDEDKSYHYEQPGGYPHPPPPFGGGGGPRRRIDDPRVPAFLRGSGSPYAPKRRPALKDKANDPYEERRRLTKLLYLGPKSKTQKVEFNVHNHNYRKIEDEPKAGR